MDIHILLDAPEEEGAHISFDTTPENSKKIPLVPLLEKLQKFIDTHQKKCDTALIKQHPYFSKFSVEKQTQIIKEFRQTYTVFDLDNPAPDTKAVMIILN